MYVNYLAYQHLNTTLKEEEPPTPLVDTIDGHQSGADVDNPGDNSRHEGGIVTEPDGAEQNRRVKHDNIDTGELLEEGDQDGHAELRPVLPLQQPSPGVLHLLGGVAGGDKVVEFFVNVLDTADFL